MTEVAEISLDQKFGEGNVKVIIHKVGTCNIYLHYKTTSLELIRLAYTGIKLEAWNDNNRWKVIRFSPKERILEVEKVEN